MSARPAASDDLPPGWTRHIAPSGHYYYYNKATKQSSYEKPAFSNASVAPGESKSSDVKPSELSKARPDPSTAGDAQRKPALQQPRATQSQDRSSWAAAYMPGFEQQQKRQQRKRRKEEPVLMRELSLKPWCLAVTNLGRPFVYNLEEKKSLWMPPPDVSAALELIPREELILMIARCRGLRNPKDGSVHFDATQAMVPASEVAETKPIGLADEEDFDENDFVEPDGPPMTSGIIRQRNRSPAEDDGDSDSESGSSDSSSGSGDSDSEEESDSDEEKGENEAEQVEFDEEDIEWQIQAMMAENGLDGEEDIPYVEKVKTFRQMLMDLNVNPYSNWETEMNKLVEDTRYFMLQTASERIAVFQDWAKERIAELKEQKANETRISPEDLFSEFLRQYATPKLFYAEFKRKYRKEAGFKDSRLSDREKEKMYREYIDKLKKKK
ncbi:hypothetical protein BZA70DRAFT_11034 [Myxozyma melibiosi]|uniref:WW domain-containing protein n=1 Tax=Myxozyma melibiosi TaxID=54550 RepID=A0ABR1FBY1_9ASCO